MNKLAIIIPFYKIAHFEALLDALSNQTCRNFTVYIGDDASAENPGALIERYAGRLDLVYRRFSQRLGNVSLTRQWERCLKLAGQEEWLWFIPDDDLPSPGCVEAFYAALQSEVISRVKVFRLPLNIIDGAGTLIKPAGEYPLFEDNYQFYLRQLRGIGNGSSLGDNIFRRSAFENCGGFVDFPKAWGSDHATILHASSGGLIYCLKDAPMSFRMSGVNISSDVTDGQVKMNAKIAFANWLKSHEHIFPDKPDEVFYRYIYWKGEHYAMYEWEFSAEIWLGLYRLRRICIRSANPLPLLLLMMKRFFMPSSGKLS